MTLTIGDFMERFSDNIKDQIKIIVGKVRLQPELFDEACIKAESLPIQYAEYLYLVEMLKLARDTADEEITEARKTIQEMHNALFEE